jgi:hypothetical protein
VPQCDHRVHPGVPLAPESMSHAGRFQSALTAAVRPEGRGRSTRRKLCNDRKIMRRHRRSDLHVRRVKLSAEGIRCQAFRRSRKANWFAFCWSIGRRVAGVVMKTCLAILSISSAPISTSPSNNRRLLTYYRNQAYAIATANQFTLSLAYLFLTGNGRSPSESSLCA